jgi:GTP-binding protein
MKPIVAIVGRENVGKSTLFNRLAGKNKAVIDDLPGLTRDRNYAEVRYQDREFILIDTGGFEPHRTDSLSGQIRAQTRLAIEEADGIIFVADGTSELTPADFTIVRMLQSTRKPVLYIINKIDRVRDQARVPDYYRLGVDPLLPVSAKNGSGIPDLMEALIDRMPALTVEDVPPEVSVKIAIVGRPNVGKSSLVNALSGDQRLVTDATPGTTRDATDTIVSRNHQNYLLIDTAGIRRKSRVSVTFEKFCIIEALKSLDRCDVGILLLDATEGVAEQDAKIARFIYEKGKGCIIAVNKWDLMPQESSHLREYLDKVRFNLSFLEFAPVLFISALTGQRLTHLLKTASLLKKRAQRRIQTPLINDLLRKATERHPAPQVKNRPLKFYYAAQIAEAPPHFVVFSNHPSAVPESYRRFLINRIRERFGFEGIPIRLSFRDRKKAG